MEHGVRQRESGSGWVLLAVAFVLLCVANGRWHTAPAAWLAPLFVLLFLNRQPAGRGLGLAFVAQLLAFFVNWRGMIPVPGLWYYLVTGIYAGVSFLPFVAHRLLTPRIEGFRSTLVFPASFVTVEFLFHTFVTPYGSWASPAYTQTAFLPLLQLAAVTGLGGIVFLMMWSAAVVARVREEGFAWSRIRTGVATWGAVLLAVLAWGQWRIVSVPEDRPSLRVAGLTPSASLTAELQEAVASSSAGETSEIALRINDDLIERTRREIAAGTEVVVWSEHAGRVTRELEAPLIERAQALARSSGVALILGIGLWDPESNPAFENKVVTIEADGTLAGVYHKARPIAGQESGLIAGGEGSIATLDTARGRFGIVICHDLDFPGLLREAGRKGVHVLFAPSADWAAITPFHAQMAVPRAVENGCSLVRPCANGLSLVVDPLGRTVAAQLDRGEAGNALTAQVPLSRMRTIYPIVGDGFAYVNILVFLYLLVSGLRMRALRRRSAGGESR